jgi:glycerophosphoryl diester phosphodiesterase
VYTWTVDADARMRALAECGVDGIMTNYPERLRTVVGD